MVRAQPPVILSAEKVLAGSGTGPVGEDSAAPQESTSYPDAGWKGCRPEERSAWSTESPKTMSDTKATLF